MSRRPPRRSVIGPRFDGARELDAYLRDGDIPVPVFCEQNRLDRFHVDRLLRGQAKRSPPVEIVLALQSATGGRVVPSMWTEASLRDDVLLLTASAPEKPDWVVPTAGDSSVSPSAAPAEEATDSSSSAA